MCNLSHSRSINAFYMLSPGQYHHRILYIFGCFTFCSSCQYHHRMLSFIHDECRVTNDTLNNHQNPSPITDVDVDTNTHTHTNKLIVDSRHVHYAHWSDPRAHAPRARVQISPNTCERKLDHAVLWLLCGRSPCCVIPNWVDWYSRARISCVRACLQ